MRQQQKLALAALIAVLLAGMLVMLPVAPAQAIGEITPTPSPTPFFDVEAMIDQAVADIQQGNLTAAIEAMDQVLEIEPENSNAYFIRGIAYSQEGRFNRAIDDFTRGIEIVPYDWTLYTFRGDAYAQIDDIGQAMMDYDRAIYLNPRFENAYRSRSALNFRLGNADEAVIDDTIAQGISRSSFDDAEGAIELFTDVIENTEDPLEEIANAYYNRALVMFADEDWDSIINDLNNALELQSDMHDSYLARGIALQESGDTQRAGVDFVRRMELLEINSFDDTLDGYNAPLTVEMQYGSVYRITFEGTAGDVITATARSADPEVDFVDPLLALMAPDGSPIAGDDDFGGGELELDSMIKAFELPDDGTYTLVVSHANGGYEGMIEVLVVEDAE